MKRKRQLHDGIAGALITAGVALGYYVNPLWLLLPGILGVALLQSGFTGFCPVYFILARTCPEEYEQVRYRRGMVRQAEIWFLEEKRSRLGSCETTARAQ